MRLPPRFRGLFYASAVFLFLLTVALLNHINFQAYGIGHHAKDPAETIRPDSPRQPDVWRSSVRGIHPPRLNETYGDSIPNFINFVYILPKGVTDFDFFFKQAIAVYSTWLFTDPDIIYFHTNAAPEAIERARSGARGKWNSMILNVPQLIIKHVESPDRAGNGVEITLMQHKSDFVRVTALEENGGIYLDMDAIPLRDLRPLLGTGFSTVLGRQLDGQIMSGNFIGKAGCQFFTRWRIEMHKIYDQRWLTHSNDLMTRLGKRLVGLDREILILEAPAMGPVHWWDSTRQALYAVHNDVKSNLEGLVDGDPLRDFTDRLEGPPGEPLPKDCASWEGDYSDTYILHSWREKRGFRLPHGFDHVTPRYVLERRSDFSRAVYHIVKHMYDQGFVKFDDPWKYTVLEK